MTPGRGHFHRSTNPSSFQIEQMPPPVLATWTMDPSLKSTHSLAATVPIGSAPFAVMSPVKGPTGKGPFSIYAYLFYRPYAAPGSAATTYGGSQIFARADYRLGRTGLRQRSTLYARASRDTTPDGRAEFALGLSTRPVAGLPVTLHGERRIRPSAPDATAVFVSGGAYDVPLPYGATLNAYGQGGVVLPDKGKRNPFYDGQASVTKPVHRDDNWRLDAGALVATGGQDGTARLDIGPVVALSGSQSGTQWRGEAGWRFRVAGDAAPANGPAVMVSVGF